MNNLPLPRHVRFQRQLQRVVLTSLCLLSLARVEAAEPLFFLQFSDPQFGMCASDANFQQETANLEFAIATANRLKPAFVVVTGDLINRTGDTPQMDEYFRVTAKLDKSIPLYHLPGNHDLGNDPTPTSIAAYVDRFGPDHYAFRCGPVMGLVLNSCLLRSAKDAVTEAARQDAWLEVELAKARAEKVPHVIVFQHHPWFVENIDEPDAYHNLPLAGRRHYLDLFRQYGVTHIFAGHYHANVTAKYEWLEMVTTGAVGKPLQKDSSGLRVVIVRDTGIEHRFYHLGEIPNQIDLSPPKPVEASNPPPSK